MKEEGWLAILSLITIGGGMAVFCIILLISTMLHLDINCLNDMVGIWLFCTVLMWLVGAVLLKDYIKE